MPVGVDDIHRVQFRVSEISVPESECSSPTGDIPLDAVSYQAYLQPVSLAERDTLPSSYDARTDGIVTPPKNQGSCGSCWAFASVGAMESHLLAAGFSQPLDLAEQQQVSCNLTKSGCCGGSATAITFWETQGPTYEFCFAYGDGGTSCPVERSIPCSSGASCSQVGYKVTNFHTVPSTQFRESLWVDGPSYFRYDVYTDFSTFWSGASTGAVYTNTGGSYRGGHAVLIIGWSDAKQAYLFKNSWGATSGPEGDGTFWMAYAGHTKNLNLQMANFDIYHSSPDDIYEENDSLAEAFALGENITLSGIQADEDWYRIDVRSGYEDVAIQVQFTHSEGDINLALTDPSGVTLAEFDLNRR